MNERKKKGIIGAILALILIVSVSIVQIATAEPRIRVTQRVKIDKWHVVNETGDTYWSIGEVSRVGPGGYAPIEWCITNEDEDFSLKGYYAIFIVDPEKTVPSMDWEMIKEESNSETGYRWDFGDIWAWTAQNSYLTTLMGNYARLLFNTFSSVDLETVDTDVCLAITDEEPEEPSFFSKFIDNKIFGITLCIPDLEPTTREGRHSWCVSEGFELKWYDRINPANIWEGIKTNDAKPYLVIGRDARIGDEHKLVALVCSADPSSAWRWTSFNVISHEEITFVIEKPQVSQTLGIGVFIAFVLIGGWYTKIWKRLGLG